jgi:hypothetical protein
MKREKKNTQRDEKQVWLVFVVYKDSNSKKDIYNDFKKKANLENICMLLFCCVCVCVFRSGDFRFEFFFTTHLVAFPSAYMFLFFL